MRTTNSAPWLLLSLSALMANAAHADGFATDTELMRPSFSPDTVPGIDTPRITAPGSWRTGMFLEYQRDPLVVKLYGYDAGSVVENRITSIIGGSYDINKWLSVRGALPLAYQSGADIQELAADGFGLGDIRLGARAALPAGGVFHPGIRADVEFPVGYYLVDRPEDNSDIGNYLSEQAPRFTGGLIATLDVGMASVLLDAGFTGRKEVDTPADFRLGPELVLNGGLLLHLWPEKVALGAGVLSRSGAKDLWQADSAAENTAEVYSNLTYRLTRNLQLDAGVGRGLTGGYGSTGMRALAALTFIHTPPPPPPEAAPVVKISEEPPKPPEPVFEEPTDKPWEEGQLARVSGLHIEIRDPILFEFGTPVIRDISIPTLKSVAEILEAYGQIDHLLIEGHASEEGSFEYNYNLSTSRAQAIFNKLIELGIHPSRLSYRGMGETMPIAEGTSEEALAANRRVIFEIVKLLDPLAPIPQYPSTIKLPWNGEIIQAPQPGSTQIGSGQAPGVQQKPKTQDTEKVREDFFKNNDDDDSDFPMPTGGGGGTSGDSGSGTTGGGSGSGSDGSGGN